MLLATKLKNHVAALMPEAEVANLKNISVNGVKRGCSGFFYNPTNKRWVYVCTDLIGSEREVLFRAAKDARDYRGSCNRYTHPDKLAAEVVKLLTCGRDAIWEDAA